MFRNLSGLVQSDDNYEELAASLYNSERVNGLKDLSALDFKNLIKIAIENNAQKNMGILLLYSTTKAAETSNSGQNVIEVPYPNFNTDHELKKITNLLSNTLNQCGQPNYIQPRDVVDQTRKSLEEFFTFSKNGSKPFLALGYKKTRQYSFRQAIMLLKCTLVEWGVDTLLMVTEEQVLRVANKNLAEQFALYQERTQLLMEPLVVDQEPSISPNNIGSQSKSKQTVIEIIDPELSEQHDLSSIYSSLKGTLLNCGVPKQHLKSEHVKKLSTAIKCLNQLFAFSKNRLTPSSYFSARVISPTYQHTMAEKTHYEKVQAKCNTKGLRYDLALMKRLKCTLVEWGVDPSLLQTQEQVLRVANENLEQQYKFYIENTLPLYELSTVRHEPSTLQDVRFINFESDSEQSSKTKKSAPAEALIKIESEHDDAYIVDIDALEMNERSTHEVIPQIDLQLDIENWVNNLDLESPEPGQPMVSTPANPTFFGHPNQNASLTLYGPPQAEQYDNEIDLEKRNLLDTLSGLAISDENYEELGNCLFHLLTSDILKHLNSFDFQELIRVARENNALNNLDILHAYVSYNDIDSEVQTLELLPPIQQQLDEQSNPEQNSITFDNDMRNVIEVIYPIKNNKKTLKPEVDLLKKALNILGKSPEMKREIVDEARKSLEEFFFLQKNSKTFRTLGFKRNLLPSVTQSIMLLKCMLIEWGINQSLLKTQREILRVANKTLLHQLTYYMQHTRALNEPSRVNLELSTVNQDSSTLQDAMVNPVKKPSARLFSEVEGDAEQPRETKKPKLVEAPVVIDLESDDSSIADVNPVGLNEQATPDTTTSNVFYYHSPYQSPWLTFHGTPLADQYADEMELEKRYDSHSPFQ